MIAVVQRLASLRRFTAPGIAACRFAIRSGAVVLTIAGLALAVASSMGGCTARSLLEVDVTSSDTDFQSVKLRLSAGGTSQDFAGATFTASVPFKAGLYADASGSVTVVANVLDGSGHCIGAGAATLTGCRQGLGIERDHADGGAHHQLRERDGRDRRHQRRRRGRRRPARAAAATSGSGGNGSGSGGNGSGGSGNGSGGSSGGTGGMNGGAGGSTNGGTNLVMNGDFSNGSNGWGLPAMMGQVSQMVTAGQFCVMVQQLSSATIGYPSGGVPPFQIDGGKTYTFSYQASSTGNLVDRVQGRPDPDTVRRHRLRLHERVGQRFAADDHAHFHARVDGQHDGHCIQRHGRTGHVLHRQRIDHGELTAAALGASKRAAITRASGA